MNNLYPNPTNLSIQLYGEKIANGKALIENVQSGDKVTALFPNGKSIKNGKIVQDYKQMSGKVNPLLIFADHIIINLGGKYGTPGYVDANNIVSVRRSA